MWPLALAGAVTLGAWLSRPAPLLLTVALAAGAVATRRAWLVCVAMLLVANALGARAAAGMVAVERSDVTNATVTLLTDPAPSGPGVRAIGRLGRRHVELVAYGRAVGALRARLAGERVVVDGALAPLPSAQAGRLAPKHVVGRLSVKVVSDWLPGDALSSSANRVRRALVRGAASMPARDRALFTGFVIGDDRDEPRDLVDDFRASGLAHLTAVSGENVAFVLVAAGPLLRRLSLRGRWVATLALVGWFAMLTRFEPSVLRACAMAALAATATFLARPASGVRLLSLAVAACVLADPFLVRSVGWWLSVGATSGLVLFARRIADALPGPQWLAEPLATTIAAQVGVAPVTVAVFGAIPLASIPANLLAVPAAAPVMVWGLPVGIIAGVVPPWFAHLAHVPTLALVRWIELVARIGARLPLPALGRAPLVVIATVVAATTLWRRHHGRHPVSSATMERPV